MKKSIIKNTTNNEALTIEYVESLIIEADGNEEQSLEGIVKKIMLHKRQAEMSFLEIGKLLIKAKTRVEHGQWLMWLQDNVDMSYVTAGRLMRIAKEFANNSPVTNLGYSKVSVLLTLPKDERNEFLNRTHNIGGIEKKVQEMSKREIQDQVRERLIALKPAPPTEDEFQLEPITKKSQKSKKLNFVSDFIANINKLDSCVNEIISGYFYDPVMYSEAYNALYSFCMYTLENIPETDI
jgi:hypothetical protein